LKKKLCLTKITLADSRNCSQLYTTLYESDLEISRKLPIGQRLSCSGTDRDIRNLGHHKKLFSLLKLTMQNLPEKYKDAFKNQNQLLEELKVQSGHIEKRTSLGGSAYFVPKSIAFDSMSQDDFSEFYDAVVDIVCKYILPDVSSKKLDEQILNFM